MFDFIDKFLPNLTHMGNILWLEHEIISTKPYCLVSQISIL